MLGPGLLIAIPYSFALLFALFGLYTLVGNEALRSSSRDVTVLIVLFCFVAVHFVAVIAGAVGMFLRGPRWLSITTCVAAMLPTIFVATACLGILLYPIALGGCVWGLVALFGKPRSRAGYAGVGDRGTSAGPQASYPFAGAAAPSPNHPPRAQTATGKSSSDDGNLSQGKAILCILGGIGCVGFGLFAAYSYYQYLNGEAEVRRPGRALSGTVVAMITGIGLIIQGIAFFIKRSG